MTEPDYLYLFSKEVHMSGQSRPINHVRLVHSEESLIDALNEANKKKHKILNVLKFTLDASFNMEKFMQDHGIKNDP